MLSVVSNPKSKSNAKGLKELQESIVRCFGHFNITEILLKTALNTIQSFIKYGLV